MIISGLNAYTGMRSPTFSKKSLPSKYYTHVKPTGNTKKSSRTPLDRNKEIDVVLPDTKKGGSTAGSASGTPPAVSPASSNHSSSSESQEPPKATKHPGK
jgi:hypothetical protein